MQCHIWLKRWGSHTVSLCCMEAECTIDFYVLDGLSVYSALLILTFIANMFPLIGSFVKERRRVVLFWQWLMTIISCLSIFHKPTLTQQHGRLSASAHCSSISLFIYTCKGLTKFSNTIQSDNCYFGNNLFISFTLTIKSLLKTASNWHLHNLVIFKYL